MEEIIREAIGKALDEYAEGKIHELNEKYLQEFEKAMKEKQNELVLNVLTQMKIENNIEQCDMVAHIHIKL